MAHGLNLRAFVARRPDENHVGVYRWLLERNLKLPGICFALDALGDIYLTAAGFRSSSSREPRSIGCSAPWPRLPTTASM